MALSLACSWRLAAGRIVVGSPEGGWAYPRVGAMTLQSTLAAAAAVALAITLLRATARIPAGRESLAVLAWLAGGLVIQPALRVGAPASMAEIVVSDRANSFYSPTLRYGPLELIQRREELAPALPPHARSNMPGKVVFFHVLRVFAESPGALALLILGFSSLGALLLHQIVLELSGDRRAALFGAALYLLTPGRIAFLPVLNTATPAFVLLPLWLQARATRTGRSIDGVLLGLSLYLLLLFEPLPLAMAPVFAAFVAGALARGRLAASSALALVLRAAAAFLAAHALVLALLRYDALAHFLELLQAARDFNVEGERPYGIWVVQNLRDFTLCLGTASVVLVLVTIIGVFLPRAGRHLRERLLEPEALLALSLLLVLIGLDLAGINRGEVVRLWIFLACTFQMVPALVCARLPGLIPIGAILASTMIQAAVAATTVGFVLT